MTLRRSHTTGRCPAGGALSLLCLLALPPAGQVAPTPAATAPADPRPPGASTPLDLVPADALLCWAAGPWITTPARTAQPAAVDVLLEVGARVAGANLDPASHLNVRIAELLGLALRYPHAIALVDASAQPTSTDPRARRLDKLRLAAVVQLAEDDGPIDRDRLAPFLRIIQRAVNEQTDAGTATLTTQPADNGAYQELRDRRLPEWAVLAWGQLRGYFVLTIGQEVWPLIAATAAGRSAPLSRVEWVSAARARAQPASPAGPRPTAAPPPLAIEVLVRVAAIRERLDPFVGGRASDFFRAWNAEAMTWSHWSLRSVGRAFDCRAQFSFGELNLERVYADPNEAPPELVRTVPNGLPYAIFHLPLERFVPRATAGWLAIQGPHTQATLRRHWTTIADERRLLLQRDLLPYLGPHVIVHNHPPHPLGIPVLATVLVELRGDTSTARRALDQVCQGWAAVLVGKDGANQAPRGSAPFTLVREPDGLWYMRFRVSAGGFGLAGPAWVTTDRFLVLSWSPLALREYLADAGDVVGRIDVPTTQGK